MQSDTQTSAPSTAPHSGGEWTLFPAASLASPTPLPGSEEARQMTVRSGRKCFASYEKYSPLGCFAKMLLESSRWHSTVCVLTWKASATPARRLLFRLVPSVPRTEETGYGLLPTPTANGNNNRAGLSPKSGDGLSTAVRRLLPTPTAQDARNLTCPPSQKDRCSIPGFLLSQSGSPPIHPTLYELLMGYPEGYTVEQPVSAPSETPSSPNSPSSSSK